MKILYIVPYALNMIRTRLYHLIQALRKRGHVVTLGTLWEDDPERQKLEEFAGEYSLQLIASRLDRLRVVKNLAGGLFTHSTLPAVSWIVPEWKVSEHPTA